jgi:RNA polymerase sigma-70 factor (sigma-E family)
MRGGGAAVRQADEQLYVEYVTARLPELQRLASALCKDGHRADDVVQAAITKLYVHWRRAKAADNLDAYTRKIVVHAFLNEKRLRWSGVHLTDELGDAPAGEAPGVETRLLVADALAQIPPKPRAVLVLRFLYDLPVREVAETLNCPENTVKSHTARGLALLRRALGSRPEIEGVVP